MIILGVWAVGNMATGAVLRGNRVGEDRYFHDMNIAWNAVNLTIAGLGYYASMKADPASFDMASSIHEQYKIQKILLFNAGLDVGYMLGGVYLMERSKNTNNNPERLKGFGKSIVLQGGFLFAFDVVTYMVHTRGNGEIPALLQGLSFNGQGIGIYWQF